MVAERRARRSTAISPKKCPTPSRTRSFLSSIWTSPAAMKYIECAASPRRTITSPGSTVCARINRMMSAISPALSSANSGTRATMPQVTTKSRRWISSAKAVATMPTGSAIMISPVKIVIPATIRPNAVAGTTSP